MNGPTSAQAVDWSGLAELARQAADSFDLPAVAELAEVLAHRHRLLHLRSERNDIPDFRLQVNSLVGARWHDPQDDKDTSGPLDIDFLPYAHENRISRLHARLWCQDGLWRVDDCSTNGTFVNGQRLGRGQSCLLKPGDRLCFAHLCFEVDLSQPNPVGQKPDSRSTS